MKRSRIITVGACLLILGAGCGNSSFDTLDTLQEPSGDVTKLTQTDLDEAADMASTSTEPSEASTSTQSSNDEPAMIDRTNLSFPGVLPKDQTDKNVRIKTSKGDILIELLPDEGPNAASNFVYLINHRYYDGLTFHRREPGFVIQGGDPKGDGSGGPGYAFKDDPVNMSYNRGIVAMANAGPNTNGSQFFIMLGDTPLSPNYSIFGRVIEGLDTVDKIAIGDVMETVTLEDK